MYDCITGFFYTSLSQIFQILYFLVERLYLSVASKIFFFNKFPRPPPYGPNLLSVTKVFCWCSLTQSLFVNTELLYWLAFNKNNFSFSIKTVPSTDLQQP